MLEAFEKGANDAAAEGSSRGLRFSSSELLQTQGNEENAGFGGLGLPSGALFSPFAELHPPPAKLQRPPILCIGCAAYPNAFCDVDRSTGGWRCCFCRHWNPCYAEEFIGTKRSAWSRAYPEMAGTVVEYVERSLTNVMNGLSLATGPHRRRDAWSWAPAWVFVVDGNMPRASLQLLAGSLRRALQQGLDPDSPVALVVYTGAVSLYRVSLPGVAVAETLPGHDVSPSAATAPLLAGGAADFFVPARAAESVCDIVAALCGTGGPPAATAAAATVTAIVPTEAAVRSEGFIASSSNGGSSSTGGIRGGRRRREALPLRRRKRCLGAAMEYALRLVAAAARPAARVAVLAGGAPNHGPGAAATLVPATAAAAAAAAPSEAALLMTEAMDYFHSVGTDAAALAAGVDVFCGGAEVLAVPALQALVRPTGGYVVVTPSFDDELGDSLAKCARRMRMSGEPGRSSCVVDVRVSPAVELTHAIGPAVLTDTHANVDAAAYAASAAAAAGAASGGGGSRKGSTSATNGAARPNAPPPGGGLCRMTMGRIDPHAALALYFSDPDPALAGDSDDSGGDGGGDNGRASGAGAAYFQFVVRSEAESGVRVTRVITHRALVTRDPAAHLGLAAASAAAAVAAKSANAAAEAAPLRAAAAAMEPASPPPFLPPPAVDAEVLAVLLAKRAVLRATYGVAEGAEVHRSHVASACSDVEMTLAAASRRYRNWAAATSGGRGSDDGRRRSGSASNSGGGSTSWAEGMLAVAFPPALAALPELMFHLLRGPLLGPLLQNPDDALALRHVFLLAGLDEGLRLMAPRLWALDAVTVLAAAAAAAAAVAHAETSPPPLPAQQVSPLRPKGAADGAVSGNACAAEALSPLPAPENGTTARNGAGSGSAAAVPVTAAMAGAALAVVPADASCMRGDRILVLDAHDRIFVWSGAAVGGVEYDVLRAAVVAAVGAEAAGRFPTPRVALLRDGSSAARYLTSRLAPAPKAAIGAGGGSGDGGGSGGNHGRSVRQGNGTWGLSAPTWASAPQPTDDLSFGSWLFGVMGSGGGR
ncbi:unnamed protein product [Phaeothamnion confervicola]